MINLNMRLSGFTILLQFFACLQVPHSLHRQTQDLQLFISFLHFSVQQSPVDMSHGHESSAAFMMVMFGQTFPRVMRVHLVHKDVEMHLQGDLPLEPALTIAMKSAGVRLLVQQNQSKGKLRSVKLWKILVCRFG